MIGLPDGPKEECMPTTKEIVEAYGASWNEPDEAKRRLLLELSWTDDGVFQDPRDRAEGREALLALIAGFRQAFAGGSIVLTSGVDEHHGLVRFTWSIRDVSGKAVLDGIDFGELADDGRLKRIAGFWGPTPAIA
jgi:hypothetical protein